MKKFYLLCIILCITFFAVSVSAKDITFSWDANTESDLAGYRLYQSDQPGVYNYGPVHAMVTIPAGTETCVLSGVVDGTWYWVLTAYDTEGNESGPSNEVSDTVDETAPAPPTNLHFQ